MAWRRRSKHSLQSSSSSEDSDDASLLEIGEAITFRSGEDMSEKEKMTESRYESNGEKNTQSSLGSVAGFREQSSGKENRSSSSESKVEVIGGDVNSSKKGASVSVEIRGEETEKGKWKGKEKAEEEDRDCRVEKGRVARDGGNKKKRQRSNSNLAGTMPVAWRTRSFTKDQQRIDYTFCYGNADCEFGSTSGSENSGETDQEESRSKTDYGSDTSSDCSLDIDEVPILERMKKMKKQHNANVEDCSWIHLEEIDNVVSLSSSDDAVETVRNVEKMKRLAKEKRVWKSKHRKTSSRKIADKDLFDFLMRSLDEEGEEVPGSSQNQGGENLPRELPLVFDFGSDEEPPIEKSESEKLEDELWEDFDFALGMENLGSYNPDEVLSES